MTDLAPADERSAVRWVRAILAIFSVTGFGFGSWLSRIPSVRDGLGASTFEMSLLVLCMAAGSVAGLLVAGPLIERLGQKRAMRITLGSFAASLPAAAALILLPGTLPIGLLLLFVFGFSFSTLDIAMNVSGAGAERALGKPRLPLMHACFSIGAGIALGLGAGAEALRIPVQLHLLIAATAIATVGFLSLKPVPTDRPASTRSGAEKTGRAEGRGARSPHNPWRDPRVIMLGLITMVAGLAEGTPSDWLPLALVDGRGFSNEFGTTMLSVFFVGMIVSRLSGSYLLTRFSRVRVLTVALLVATLGMLVLLLVPTTGGAVIGVIAWGLGTGIVWPTTISASADRPETAVRDVAVVSAIGYTAMLLGPMLFGVLGESIGLLSSFWILPVITLLALLLVRAARPAGSPIAGVGARNG